MPGRNPGFSCNSMDPGCGPAGWLGPGLTGPRPACQPAPQPPSHGLSDGPGRNDAGGETWEGGKIMLPISPTNLAEVEQRAPADSMGKDTRTRVDKHTRAAQQRKLHFPKKAG